MLNIMYFNLVLKTCFILFVRFFVVFLVVSGWAKEQRHGITSTLEFLIYINAMLHAERE